MKQIIGANHRITRIEMTLPVDVNGEYAFDENGKPVKGVTPVVLTVPRWDSLDREEIKAMNKALSEFAENADESLSVQDRSAQTVLIMLRPFVTEDELKVVERLKPMELDQIAEYWQEQSTISLGESLASTNS